MVLLDILSVSCKYRLEEFKDFTEPEIENYAKFLVAKEKLYRYTFWSIL